MRGRLTEAQAQEALKEAREAALEHIRSASSKPIFASGGASSFAKISGSRIPTPIFIQALEKAQEKVFGFLGSFFECVFGVFVCAQLNIETLKHCLAPALGMPKWRKRLCPHVSGCVSILASAMWTPHSVSMRSKMHTHTHTHTTLALTSLMLKPCSGVWHQNFGVNILNAKNLAAGYQTSAFKLLMPKKVFVLYIVWPGIVQKHRAQFHNLWTTPPPRYKAPTSHSRLSAASTTSRCLRRTSRMPSCRG